MIRADGTRVEIYNEGLTVYLFDEANAAVVRNGLDTAEREGSEPATLLELARAGTLVMYELWQDDPLVVEVAVGEPLTAKEKRGVKWMKLVRMPIALPSGKLRIETGATLYAPEEHAPGIVDVAPGTYELALHRIDREKVGELEAYDGPETVITLTPWPPSKKFRPKAAVIYCGDAPRAPFVGRYEVADGVFRGEVISCLVNDRERRLNVNLDHAAYERLALSRGRRLSLTAGGRDYAVLCQGRMIRMAAELFLGEPAYDALAGLDRMLLVGFLSNSGIGAEPKPPPTASYRHYDYFVVGTISDRTEAFTGADDDFNRLFHLEPGAPVELRVLAEPYFELDAALRDDWRVDGDALHCRVVFCNARRLYLNAGLTALKALGFSDGDALELEAGAERRKIFDKKYMPWQQWDALMKRELRAPPKSNRERLEAIEARLEELPPGEGEDLDRERGRLQYHPDDLRRPPLTLGFQESKDFAGWEMMECKSALAGGFYEPEEIHVDLRAGDPVVIRLAAFAA